MELSSFRHQSDSRYCFAIGPDRVLLRLGVAKSVRLDRVEVVYGDPMTFGKTQHTLPTKQIHVDAGFRYYEAVVEASPMRLQYVFRLYNEEGVFYFSESGLGPTFAFNLAFISAFQFVGENKADFVLEKPSWAGRVFYQIFPERFASSVDPKTKPYVNAPWDCEDLPSRRNAFLGGDLQGVIDKLDYLADLGVGAIYLTPIHPSPTNHKYDVMDYFGVDPAFGGPETFHRLVDASHGKGMKVVMDLVFNHCSSSHPFFEDVKRQGRKSRYHSWFFIDGDKPRAFPLNYRCFGYFPHMPKFDTNNPEVQDYLISVGEYWMKEYHVDGFRLDVSEGVSHDFWNKFKLALKRIDPEVLLLGENWLNSESYLGPNQLDGVMNYPFLGVASAYFLGQKGAKETAEALDGLLMRYKDGHNRNMLNILSSHDVQRTRTLLHDDPDLSLLAHALMDFFPGFPMVYYGEEIFMRGKGDPDNRQGMDWGSKEFQGRGFALMRSLWRLRRDEPALRSGDFETYEKDGALFVRRTLNGHGVALMVNLSDHGVPFEGELLFGSRAAGGETWPKGFAVTRI